MTFSGVFLITFADKPADRDYRFEELESDRPRPFGSTDRAPERESLLAGAGEGSQGEGDEGWRVEDAE